MRGQGRVVWVLAGVVLAVLAASTLLYRVEAPAVEYARVEVADPGAGVTLISSGQPLDPKRPAPAPPTHRYLYAGDPRRGEIAALSSYALRDAGQAVMLLNRGAIEGPAYTGGFRALVPEKHAVRYGAPVDGVATVDLSAGFPVGEPWRLAGIILTFAQFPGTRAVRLLRAGAPLTGTCYGADLAAPISPTLLQLPAARPGTHPGFPTKDVLTLPKYPFLGTVSPDGRYLVLGSAMYDRTTKRLQPFTCYFKETELPQLARYAWVPGKPHLPIAEVQARSGEVAHLCVVDPTARAGNDTTVRMADLLEWRPLPDGSGAVLLRTAATRPADGAGWGERSEVYLYRFADMELKSAFLAPWISGDMAPARNLSVSPDATWTRGTLSYSAGYDPITRFTLDLATGKATRREFPGPAIFSPDGLLAAYDRSAGPLQLPQGPVTVARYTGRPDSWSPDSRWLLCTWDREMDGPDPLFAAEHGALLYRPGLAGEFLRFNGILQWAGPDLLWVQVPHNGMRYFYLRSLSGGPDELVFRLTP